MFMRNDNYVLNDFRILFLSDWIQFKNFYSKQHTSEGKRHTTNNKASKPKTRDLNHNTIPSGHFLKQIIFDINIKKNSNNMIGIPVLYNQMLKQYDYYVLLYS